MVSLDAFCLQVSSPIQLCLKWQIKYYLIKKYFLSKSLPNSSRTSFEKVDLDLFI